MPTETETVDDTAAPSDEGEGYGYADVSVVMGTYNEEEAVAKVVTDVFDVTDDEAEVVCVDGSTDRTPEIARDHGARVIEQEPQGYGVAVREALLSATNPVVFTTDCDDTYPMDRIPEFLDLVNQGYDVVSGDRVSGGADAMPAFNEVGNRVFALAASLLMWRRVNDTTTGMRAYRREVVEEITWTENTGLSAELLIRPIMRDYEVVEVPIEYDERLGETKLNPFTGGASIGKSILKVPIQERLR